MSFEKSSGDPLIDYESDIKNKFSDSGLIFDFDLFDCFKEKRDKRL